MVKLDRKVLNVIAFSILILFSFTLDNYIVYIYVLVFPLVGSIYKITTKYDDQSQNQKKSIKLIYLSLRMVGLVLVSGLFASAEMLIMFIMVLLPLVWLESLIVFDVHFGHDTYVNWFLYILNIALHVIAIVFFYNALQIIIFFIVGLLLAVLGTFSFLTVFLG